MSVQSIKTPRPQSILYGRPAQPTLYRDVLKRLLDIGLTILMVLPVAIVVFALAAVIWLKDRHAPFYKQDRIGRNGQVFALWKLRSMVPAADQKLQNYLDSNPALRREWDNKQKLCNDPRVTPFGRFLRASSLDELPQLWNVFCGDMSLVGPRPMMPSQAKLYSGTSYYHLRPGITGLWQISARSTSSFEARVKFDDAYDRKLSLKTDTVVILRTVKVVLRGTGC